MNTGKTTSLQLHTMRKIEVVIHAENRDLVEDIFKAAGISGWTMIRDVSGMGHHGFHDGKTIFNDRTGLVMFVGVAAAKEISEVAESLARLFETCAGVLFLSDVEVIRSDYFATARSAHAT